MIVWQDPPPYVQYLAEAEALGRLSLASGACSALNYETDVQRGIAETEAYVRRAAIDRVGSDFASQTFEAAVERETAEWQMMTAEGPDDTEEEADARMVDGAAFVVSRCALSAEEYPSVIKANGDEPKTAAELFELIMRQGPDSE
jgi:hypothetical protein